MKLPSRNYATFSADFAGYQGILQHRLINSSKTGQSLGIFYGYRYYTVEFEGRSSDYSSLSDHPQKRFGSKEVGIRSVTFVHGDGKTQAFLYMTIAAGNNTTLRTELISLGVSLGVFLKAGFHSARTSSRLAFHFG